MVSLIFRRLGYAEAARVRAVIAVGASPRSAGEFGHGGGGLLVEEGQIYLLVGHGVGPALYPAGALGVVIDAIVVGVGGGGGLEDPSAFRWRRDACAEEV